LTAFEQIKLGGCGQTDQLGPGYFVTENFSELIRNHSLGPESPASRLEETSMPPTSHSWLLLTLLGAGYYREHGGGGETGRCVRLLRWPRDTETTMKMIFLVSNMRFYSNLLRSSVQMTEVQLS